MQNILIGVYKRVLKNFAWQKKKMIARVQHTVIN
jgi:hypothetical protein